MSELRVGDVLRRAEAGEKFTSPLPGARLGPAQRRRWVSGPDLTRIWEPPAPATLAEDLARFPADVSDPFA